MNTPFAPNPGRIDITGPWPQWITDVGPFKLRLDIIPAGHITAGDEFGIASFVVMAQPQPLPLRLPTFRRAGGKRSVANQFIAGDKLAR